MVERYDEYCAGVETVYRDRARIWEENCRFLSEVCKAPPATDQGRPLAALR